MLYATAKDSFRIFIDMNAKETVLNTIEDVIID